MARRRTKAFIREVPPDRVYKKTEVTKFINTMMWEGKKTLAERLFYRALDIVTEKTGEPGIQVFERAIENAKPHLEVKSRRVGGVTYQVPVEVYPRRRQSLAIRWIIHAARERKGRNFSQKLALEIIDAANNTGGAIKKKEEVRRMAEANRAFSHYAW
ncbi:MAG: 30S ribosomal protein S7 [Leptospiraceae bacterium]|nr:30S ribosomal protein S7 [Leptospiraceae bacterium]MDW8305581.1 30S ribosomal protein S7 [Leptospiraceae bacterium]